MTARGIGPDSQYAEWTVLRKVAQDKHGNKRWVCRCSCGAQAVVYQHNLCYGASRRCSKCALALRKKPPVPVVPKVRVKKPYVPLPGTRLITYDGQTHSLITWGKMRNIHHECIRNRLKRGWTEAQALGFETRQVA